MELLKQRVPLQYAKIFSSQEKQEKLKRKFHFLSEKCIAHKISVSLFEIYARF